MGRMIISFIGSIILALLCLFTLSCAGQSPTTVTQILTTPGPTVTVTTTVIDPQVSAITAASQSLDVAATTATIPPTAVSLYTPVDIKNHGVGAGYGDRCLLCHGLGGPDQYPLPPTWLGSASLPGPVQIVQGSSADHTARTNDQCLICHKVATP